MENDNKRRNIGTALGLIILLIMIIGVTYAAFQYTKSGSKQNEITTGTVSFKYNETSNGVTLTDAFPTPDSEGKKMTEATEGNNGYFDFDVTSTLGGEMEIQYYVYAVDITGDIENKLDPKYVKVYLTDQSSPENVYEGYDTEVPVYSELDNVQAKDEKGSPVTGKLLYQNKFTESGEHKYRLRLWLSEEYEDREVSRTFKMRVDVNTEASITSSDIEKPTCTIENAQPKNASRDEDITMTIKCSDNNGTVTSNMTSENIHVKQNGSEIQPTKKELSAGIATAEVTGRNGVQHTLTLNGFEQEGPISITIDEGVITDKKGNTNDEIELSTDVSISKRVTVTLANGGGVQSFGEQDKLTCDLKDSETCNVTLPTITVTPGYTGSFWSEQETAKEGKQPGSIEVSEDTTYYAIGYKEVTVTYEKKENVETIDKESDRCTYYGKETSCEVILPTIKGNKGYTQTYWGESDNTEYESRIQEEKVEVSDNKTYYAFAKDIEIPVCRQVSVEPQGSAEVTQKETVTIGVECSDTSGSITTDLQDSNIEVTTDAKADTATKEVDSGTTITNGKKYTITLSNFSETGTLAVTIVKDSIKDESNNGNDSTPLTPGITIKKAGINGIPTNDSGTTWSNGDHDKMFEFHHEATDQMEENTDYRYIGNTEKNYVNLIGGDAGKTDDNLWRIIGVFDDPSVDEGTDRTAKIKLIKDKSIGNYSWDNVNKSTDTIARTPCYYGANSWERPSAIKTSLNEIFWNGTSGQCPYCNGSSPNQCKGSPTTSCNFSSNGLKSVQDKIENMKWYLGGTNTVFQGAEAYYKAERGTTPAGYAESKTSGTGHVGLAYPSDYGYTYGAGFGTTDCFSSDLYSCDDEPTKSWLLNSDSYSTITPYSDDQHNFYVVASDGTIGEGTAMAIRSVRPVVYLKSNIGIAGGEGTKDEPYTVGEVS